MGTNALNAIGQPYARWTGISSVAEEDEKFSYSLNPKQTRDKRWHD